MQPYYERDGIVIYNCDCREVGGFLGDGAIDSIVTDPPYGLSFMGKGWDHGVPGVEFWTELLRVAKPGAHLLAFGGTRTFHRLACAIEDAGWEIRDTIMWVFGSGFPKSANISKMIDKAAGAEREKVAVGTDAAKLWDGWGTALKPAFEPITVAMKPLDGTFAANALKHGVAGLNIDGCRVEYSGDADKASATPQGKCTSKEVAAIGAEPDAGRNLERVQFERPEQKGRFPANVIHDGSDEVLAGFPSTSSGIMKAGTRRKAQDEPGSVCYGTFGGNATNSDTFGDSGSAARFFYCAKASSSERGSRPDKELPLFGEIAPGFTNTHPTVKPLALMMYLLQLVSTPTGGIVLDPFMGSGSTLVAAKALGRKAIGIEISKEYCDIAIARLNGT